MNYYRYCAKIDLDAIEKNFNGVKAHVPAGTKVMAVIKADAYGHGACAVAKTLGGKADYFGVADMDEAKELRCHGIDTPILVLSTTSPYEYADAVKYDITLSVYRLSDAEKLSAEAEKQGKTAKIHIAVDTGMSRIGFQVNKSSAEEVGKISLLPAVSITGVFSHFARADEKDKSSALLQRAEFDRFCDLVSAENVDIPVRHIDNSAGIMELDKYYDMVRVGIMLYGLYPSDEMDRSYRLYPAMELVSHVSNISLLEAGRGISYGHTFVTVEKTLVATVPVGYADGYPRCLSGKGEVLVRGVRCRILGRICMDQMMVDVGKVPEVAVGDDVVLVGHSGGEAITVDDVADNAFSFNYEFVCRVSRRVPRVYYNKGREVSAVSYLK